MVPADLNARPRPSHPTRIEAVVIGASAGAVDALNGLLPALRKGATVPVVVCVHLSPHVPSLMVDLFTTRCAVPVREASDKEAVSPGVWFAPPAYHLLFERDRTFALSVDEPVNYSRPSIDVLFESAADVYGPALACALLTGANADGARGARRIRDRGGFVMVQDPATAEVETMPRAGLLEADPQWVGSIPQLAVLLADLCGNGELG